MAGRDLTRFAGYTSRVAEFFDVLDDIRQGRYERTMVSTSEEESDLTTRFVILPEMSSLTYSLASIKLAYMERLACLQMDPSALTKRRLSHQMVTS